MQPIFKISNHARERYYERVQGKICIEEALRKSHLCNDLEEIEINTTYSMYTGGKKAILPGDVYFKYEDIIFACTNIGIKEYVVNTCWKLVKLKVPEPQPPIPKPSISKKGQAEINSRNERIQTTIDALLLFEDKKGVLLSEILQKTKGRPLSSKLKEYFNCINKQYDGYIFDKDNFHKTLKNFLGDIYDEAEKRLSST